MPVPPSPEAAKAAKKQLKEKQPGGAVGGKRGGGVVPTVAAVYHSDMNTTLHKIEPHAPTGDPPDVEVHWTLAEGTATTISNATYDGYWAIADTPEIVADDDRMTNNPMTFTDATGLAATQPATQPTTQPTTQPAHDYIIGYRKLTWDDFQMPPPVNSPNSEDAQAWTGFQIRKLTSNYADASAATNSAVATTIDGKKQMSVTFKYTEVIVQPVFDKKQSWVKPGCKDDALLQHEQVHFVIAYYRALEFQKQLKNLSVTKTDMYADKAALAAFEAFTPQKSAIEKQIQAAFVAQQATYDMQTDHGRNEAEQKKWNTWAAAILQWAATQSPTTTTAPSK
ncbi:MAG: DUF922 domain-containing Zn-dependent protease [Phycisphaerales bacterium]|nr:DUF922 domain-containing Zn-dependent protease [Phycisphaerales bacterium]